MNDRILVVEDDYENRQLLIEAIETSFSIVADEAADGKEAVEMASKNNYDIILMDIKMPGMDGYETADEIKKLEINKNTTIIYITAHDKDRKQAQKAFDSGGLDYIIKPIDMQELNRLLSLYLRFINKEKNTNQQLTNLNNLLQNEISQRMLYEDKLLKSNVNINGALETSEAAILIITEDGLIQFINSKGIRVINKKSGERIGETLGLVAPFNSKTEIKLIDKEGNSGTFKITSTKTSWDNSPAYMLIITVC